MRDDIIIRPETPKDYKDIVSLVLRSFKEGTNYSDGTDIVALIEEIRMSEYYIPELSFVAELDGKMIGYLFFLDFNTSIPALGLAIRDELRGRHLGRALVDFAIRTAKESGKGGIQLTTHVANVRGQSLYETMGFTLVGPCKNGTEFFYLYRFQN